ncbi:hypothetical protein DV515_00008874, partial [Chloebia gouldiae]
MPPPCTPSSRFGVTHCGQAGRQLRGWVWAGGVAKDALEVLGVQWGAATPSIGHPPKTSPWGAASITRCCGGTRHPKRVSCCQAAPQALGCGQGRGGSRQRHHASPGMGMPLPQPDAEGDCWEPEKFKQHKIIFVV